MASYALPVSAIPHSHNHSHSHSHVHSHSQSHSPSFSPSKLGPGGQRGANTSRSLRNERSGGNLHTQSMSDSLLDRGQINASLGPRYGRSFANGDVASRTHINGIAVGTNGSPAIAEMNGHESSPSVSGQSHDHAHDHSHNDHGHGHGHDHDHDHAGHSHSHNGHTYRLQTHSAVIKPSWFTQLILPFTEGWPLLNTIMKEKDPRRIFYFMSLNFGFMVIQAFYGFATDSLGLLSDSIHMFFDCLALALGLFAAVSSRWPPSERFPYGFGKIESLSGFGNGVFLMLISIEILIEAIERLAEGRETKRLNELLIVSSLGLVVNLVGMAAFGHHQHGHNHSHEGHDHDHFQSGGKEGPCDHDHAKPHSHGHGDENENMRGIFLHVLADTMGSAAVIVSTLLMQYIGWSGWDPLASCIIAVLIFMSSIPLVSSSAKKLLLTVPADTEYQLRNTLAGVSDLRGVASYSVPRFWMADNFEKGSEPVLGVMHIVATRGSDLEDVRERTRAFLSGHGMDVVLQVERDGETSCWCGGNKKSPSTLSAKFS